MSQLEVSRRGAQLIPGKPFEAGSSRKKTTIAWDGGGGGEAQLGGGDIKKTCEGRGRKKKEPGRNGWAGTVAIVMGCVHAPGTS